MHKTITLIGGAGAPNFGDELIVRGWLEYFGRRDEHEWNLLFLENIADKTELLMKPFSIKSHLSVTFSDFLVAIAGKRKDLSFFAQVSRGYNFIKNSGLKHYPSQHWNHIMSSDVLHLHGGGYLNEMGPEKGFLLGFAAAIQRETGCRLAATGIGFGPLKNTDNLAQLKHIFSLFDHFECRDIEGFRILKQTVPSGNFVYGLDDCFLLPRSSLSQPTSSQDRTLFLSFLEYNVRTFTDAFWDSLRDLSTGFDRIMFWESYPWQDRPVIEYVKKKIKSFEVAEIRDTVYGSIPISPQDMFITSRFHVHFIGARSGGSGYYLNDSSYYQIKHQSVVDRGSPFLHLRNHDAHLNLGTSGESRGYMHALDREYCLTKRKIADSVYTP